MTQLEQAPKLQSENEREAGVPAGVVRLAAYLLCALAIGIAIWVVRANAVNVPTMDHWVFAEYFDRIRRGTITFHDWIVPHNEHRILLTRLTVIPLAYLTRWNLRYESFLQLLWSLFIFLALARVATRQAPREQRVGLYVANTLMCGLLFSVIQVGDWLRSFNQHFADVILLGVLAIWLLARPAEARGWGTRFTLALLLTVLATYSSSNGMFNWLALVPVVLSYAPESRRGRYLALWLIAGAAVSASYFIDYHPPGGHPDPLLAFEHPGRLFIFFLNMVGMPLMWAEGVGRSTEAVGAALSFLYLLFAFQYLRHFRQAYAAQLAPWLAVGAIALLFAAAVAVGRASFGLEFALSRRYFGTMLLLPAALVQMVRIWLARPLAEPHPLPWYRGSVAVAFGTGFALHLVAVNSYDDIKEGREIGQTLQRQKICLDLVRYAPDSCLTDLLPAPPVLRKRAEQLESVGFRRLIRDVPYVEKPEHVHGAILQPSPGTVQVLDAKSPALLGGWASLPDQGDNAEVVFISMAGQRNFLWHAWVFQPAEYRFWRSIWPQSPPSPLIRWMAEIPPKRLPPGEHALEAWTYNPHTRQFIRLDGTVRVNVSPRNRDEPPPAPREAPPREAAS